MGLYNVVRPCVVGLLHYVRPTAAPIEVDDDAAAELVESGSLVPYGAGVPTDHTGVAEGVNVDPLPTGDFAPADEPVVEKPRTRRRAAED